MATDKTWHSADLETLKIRLDSKNPRIEIPRGASQDDIRRILLETEDIIKIAKGIIKTKGLLKGERIITVKERNTYIAVEGNRRVCACQLLLDPKLIPPKWADSFPRADDTVKDAIRELQADLAPNRQAAEVTITKRHTEPSIKPWSPLAKQRRIIQLLEAGNSLDEVVNEMGATRSRVNNLIQDYNLLEHIKTLQAWTQDELNHLNSTQLKSNAFTRFFTLRGVKESLGMSFDKDNKLKTTLEHTKFNRALELLAREFLLPDPTTGKFSSNTRATPQEVFGRLFAGNKDLQQLIARTDVSNVPHNAYGATGANPAPAPSTSPATTPQTASSTLTAKPQAPRVSISAKTSRFFENLVCPIKDEHLIQLAKEISSINHKTFPTAATFLMRALLENTLHYCIQHANLKRLLMKDYMAEMQGKAKGKPQPGLDYLLTFCLRNHDQIFTDNVQTILNHWKSGHKDFCDIVIHGRWIIPTEKTLVEMAGLMRPFVERVFTGSVLISP